MIWPFSRRFRQSKATDKAVNSNEFDDLPASFPINNTNHEDEIIHFLEEARTKAADLEVGQTFSLTFPEETHHPYAHPVEIIGPIMMRACDYGVGVVSTYNREFLFEVLDQR